MSGNTGLECWEEIVIEKMTGLSKPQAVLLAMLSFGIVITQNCNLNTLSTFLARLLNVKEMSMKQRLKEWYKESEAKKGEKRCELDVTLCFIPLIQWVLSWWSSDEKRMALAMDASSLGKTFVVLAISIVYRGCAIPVAWIVLQEGEKGEWRPHWESLFGHVQNAIPNDWTVIVLADRGLYASWLFNCIKANGWHPFLRVNHSYGTFSLPGKNQFLPLNMALPQKGSHWSGQVTCFKSNPVDCTLLACWDDTHSDPWLILTDLPENQADVFWYSLRSWIECGFKQVKRAGWQWHRTRMTDPQRATRLWLAIALATLWSLSVGGEAEDSLPASSFECLPLAHIARTFAPNPDPSHQISCFRRGFLTILADLIAQRPISVGRFKPFPWPSLDIDQFHFADSS